MSDPIKNRFLRIHLSTLLLLMLGASAILWANIRMHSIEGMPAFYGRGWPLRMILDVRPEHWRGVGAENQFSWNAIHAAINIAIAVFLLTSIAGVSEFFIRRKKKVS